MSPAVRDFNRGDFMGAATRAAAVSGPIELAASQCRMEVLLHKAKQRMGRGRERPKLERSFLRGLSLERLETRPCHRLSGP
jgi:hypothetical protein